VPFFSSSSSKYIYDGDEERVAGRDGLNSGASGTGFSLGADQFPKGFLGETIDFNNYYNIFSTMMASFFSD
jgi:hypothetical protein